MTLTIELTEAEAARLRALAAAKGTDEETTLHGLIAELPQARPMTGAEALDYWQRVDCLGTFADRPESSQDLTRNLREQVESRIEDDTRSDFARDIDAKERPLDPTR